MTTAEEALAQAHAIDSGDTPHVVWRLLTTDPEALRHE